MKNPARKKTNRHFRAEFTERPTECCSNNPDSLLNIALPGLTRCRTFDVISFANVFAFLYRKRRGLFVDMKLNNEFYFATAGQIYRILATPQAKKKP